MGTATLGFAGGPAITFRIDPDSIDWNWEVITNVIETIGGRVIQVIGAYLDDLTVTGSFGQDHSTPDGVSWMEAEAFLQMITAIMEFQSQDSNQQDLLHPPAVFTYPPKNWRFACYVKSFADADGGNSIVMTPGKFNQQYVLTLFIVQDASDALVKAGTTNGVFSQKAYNAIEAYMARISAGIGWHFSKYNGSAAGPADLKLHGTSGKKSGGGGPSGGGTGTGSGGTTGTTGGGSGSGTGSGGTPTPPQDPPAGYYVYYSTQFKEYLSGWFTAAQAAKMLASNPSFSGPYPTFAAAMKEQNKLNMNINNGGG